MNVCSLNINGLAEREEELRLYVKAREPDVLFLQETKTRSSELKFHLNYPGGVKQHYEYELGGTRLSFDRVKIS